MNLLRVLAAVSSMTLLSRILGFVRDTVIARVFGAGLYRRVFRRFQNPQSAAAAVRRRRILAGFRPDTRRIQESRGEEATRALVDHVSGVLALALIVVTAIGSLPPRL